jgi:hypothetical protein
MTFSGSKVTSDSTSCGWTGGTYLKAGFSTPAGYYPVLGVSLQAFATPAAAEAGLNNLARGWNGTTVPGLGETALLAHGNDGVLANLFVLAGDDVILLTLDVSVVPGIPTSYATAGKELEAAGRQIVARVAPTCSPDITSISAILPLKDQAITIKGTCFGNAPAYTAQDSPDLQLVDSRGWSACVSDTGTASNVTCTVTKWSDNEIVLAGFSGAYGSTSGDHQLEPSDSLLLRVLNPTTPDQYGSFRTSVTVDLAALGGSSYATGLALAERINKHMDCSGAVSLGICIRNAETSFTMSLEPDVQELIRNKNNRYFALGLVDNLNTLPKVSFLEFALVTQVTQMVVAAYNTGLVNAAFTQQMYSAFNDGSGGPSLDQSFMGGVAKSSVASTNLVGGLTETQIDDWSQTDQGFFASYGPFEQLAIAAVMGNWQGYANYAAYPGPLTVKQLAGLMYAATRDNTGLGIVSDSMQSWFRAHGGQPSLTNAAQLTSWVAQLTNLNGAVASPTGAYLQNIEDWLEAGEFVAKTVAETASGYVAGAFVTDVVWGWMTASDASAIAASTFASAFDAGLTFEDAFGAATTAYDTSVETETEMLKAAGEVYDEYRDLIDDNQKLSSAIDNMNATNGIKSETGYYFSIMSNTYHEAVARLIQEGLIVNSESQPVPATVSEVDYIMKNASVFFVKSPNTAGSNGPGIPVTVVQAAVYSIFMASH